MEAARRPRKPNCTELQKAARVTEDNDWGPRTDKALSIIWHVSDGQFPFGVKATQETIDAYVDGWWGPRSKEAAHKTISAVQTALTAMGFDTQGIDGIWGPNTTAAFRQAQDACQPSRPGEIR
jgi:hypothetical protein